MTRVSPSQLRALIDRLAQDGVVDRADVEQLVDATMADGVLSLGERQALQELLGRYADRIDDPATRRRVEAFLDVRDGALRAEAHALERDDGVIDLQDADRLVALAGRRGALDGDARVSLRALMVGSKLTPPARDRVERAAGDADPSLETVEQSAFPDLAIPDNDPRGVTATMRLDDLRPIARLRIELDLEHTWRGDLEVRLRAPDGTEVLLHDRAGSGADDLVGVYPLDLTPAESLDAFVGRPLAGEWTLSVVDRAGRDVGTLKGWRLSADVGAGGGGTRPRIDLEALAKRLCRDGVLGEGEVERLIYVAAQDGGATPEQRQALERIRAAYAGSMEPSARQRIDTFQRIQDGGLADLVVNLTTEGHWLDFKDVSAIKAYVEDRGLDGPQLQSDLRAVVDMGRAYRTAAVALQALADGSPLDAQMEGFLNALERGHRTLADAPTAYLQDPYFMLAVPIFAPKAWLDLPADLRQSERYQTQLLDLWSEAPSQITDMAIDSEVVMRRVLAETPHLLVRGSDALKHDRELVKIALQGNGKVIYDLDPAFLADKEIALVAVEGGFYPDGLDPSLQRDPDILRASVRSRGDYLEQLPDDMRRDPAVVLDAVKDLPKAIDFALPPASTDTAVLGVVLTADPSRFETLDPALRDRRELALAAVQADGRALEHAPERLRGDPAVVGAAVRSYGRALAWAVGDAKRDRAVVRAAIDESPDVYRYADPAAQRDPEIALEVLRRGASGLVEHLAADLFRDAAFARQAITVAPHTLRAVPRDLPEFEELVHQAVALSPQAFHGAQDLRSDRALVEQLLDAGHPVLAYADRSLLQDRALLEKGLALDAQVISGAPDAFRQDRDLARRAIELDGQAILWVDDSFRQDRELVALALDRRPDVFLSLSRQIDDEDLLLQAVLGDFRNLRYTTPAQRTPSLLTRVVEACPVALDQVAATRDEFFRDHPLQRAAYDDFKKRNNLDWPERLGSKQVIDEILRNRSEPRAAGDTRPTAIAIYPKSDHNGAFKGHQLSRLTQAYRLLYFECESDTDAVKALQQATDGGERAELLLLAGHGSRTHLALGAPDPRDAPSGPEAGYIDFSDRAQIKDALERAVAPGGHLVLESCSTGQGDEHSPNLANIIWEMVPHATVYAAHEPTNNILELDANGRFVGPGFFGGPEKTYIERPLEPDDG